MEANGALAWKPVNRQREVSAALRAYAAMTTSAAFGAVRDVSLVEHPSEAQMHADPLSRFAIPGQLGFREGAGGLIYADIDNHGGRATICLQGAHVVSFRPKSQHEPVVWVSDAAKFAKGKSIRGGAPVCWPWFGAHASEASFPAHGFARTVPWTVTGSRKRNDAKTEITLQLVDNEQTRAQWPHPTRLTLTVIVGDRLETASGHHQYGDGADPGRRSVTDAEALHAFHHLCRTEGIIPALESSHALAYAMKLAPTMRPDQHLLINLSGRGDKDIGTVADLSNADFYCRPSCRGQSVKGGESVVSLVVKS